MKPGDTAEVTPVLAVRRAGISSSQEPWQQDSGPMDPPGDDPWTPLHGNPYPNCELFPGLWSPFSEAEARGCWTHVCPSYNHPCQAQPCVSGC